MSPIRDVKIHDPDLRSALGAGLPDQGFKRVGEIFHVD